MKVEVTLRGEPETDGRGYEQRPVIAQLEMEAEWHRALDVYRIAFDKLTAAEMVTVEER